uniref:Uncharacterized protein n=1 Tax=Anopheles dirus TaxID=7168 RepID=A0A182NW03_9DIPT
MGSPTVCCNVLTSDRVLVGRRKAIRSSSINAKTLNKPLHSNTEPGRTQTNMRKKL